MQQTNTVRGGPFSIYCTGSGVVAITAARLGKPGTSPPLTSARMRCVAPGPTPWWPMSPSIPGWAVGNPRCGPVLYDLVASNPPYVPTGPDAHLEAIPGAVGPAWAWNAGMDGRLVLDPLCVTTGTARRRADRAVGIRRRRPDGSSDAVVTEVLMTQLILLGPVPRACRLAGEHRPAAGRPSRGEARGDPGPEAMSANEVRAGTDRGHRAGHGRGPARESNPAGRLRWSNPTGSWSRSAPAGAARAIRCATPVTAADVGRGFSPAAGVARSHRAPAPHQ